MYLIKKDIILPFLILYVFKLMHIEFEALNVCFEEFVS
jgi:hypothetical protein